MDYKLFWTDEAIHNLDEIIDYLRNKWTEREVKHFKMKLSKQLDLIAANPRMFPISTYNSRLRKAVLSKQTTIFYEIKNNVVYLAYLWNSKKDISGIS